MNDAPSNNNDQVLPLDSSTLLERVKDREQLREALQQQLLGMKFITFERLMLDLLARSGYSNVRLADRMDKRGRTMQGGLDLKAYSETDIARALTIVQVKQYKNVVPRRFVDELRGTMLRVGAKHGLLITTSRFSEVARRAAAAIPFLPITLIEDDALLDVLTARQIGVKEETLQRLVVDGDFFAGLK